MPWATLVAMTTANSMILVDQTAVPLASPRAVDDLGASIDLGQWLLTANILPLAAFMVLGGRLGDLLGLRRVFVAGAITFMLATVMAGLAQDMPWMLAARAVQGLGAACMMPTAVAITSAVAPERKRGTALGILAGGSAFFAALGPVLGGVLTEIDWRLVFLVNVPLAAVTIALCLARTPQLRPEQPGTVLDLDYAGVATLAIGAVGIVFGLSRIGDSGFSEPTTLIALIAGVGALVAFVAIELRVGDPLVDLRLLRNRNFLAANLSQLLAGATELGLGFLLPFTMLLVIGVDPMTAGIALIPATVPIILAGPIAGRAYDKVGGRIPLVAGFLVLAASGAALAVGISSESVAALVPGLALQGLGLGVVLTVNDPVGLNAVAPEDRGRAAGIINTTEQLGGALGISILLAIELSAYRDNMLDRLADKGIVPTLQQEEAVRDFIIKADQEGLAHVPQSKLIEGVYHDLIVSHVHGFRIAFMAAAGLALIGALVCWVLVRGKAAPDVRGVFSRRSRWHYANAGRTPGLTRHPPVDG